MAVTICGTLKIKSITGRNGAFSVGDLITEIGTFKVKDTVLDQYQSGDYSGEFVVQQIYPSSYVSYGKVVTEIRATLSALNISSTTPREHEKADEEAGEPDPIKLTNPVTPLPDAVTQHPEPEPEQPLAAPANDRNCETAPPEPEANTSAVSNTANASKDVALFGNEIMQCIWERLPVKLDPTIDRAQFRAQRDRLGKNGLGWSFDPKLQTWNPPKAA